MSEHLHPAIQFEIQSLNDTEREHYPTIVYEQATTSAIDTQALLLALWAAKDVGIPLAVDVNNNQDGVMHAVVRSADQDRTIIRTQSAVFHGATALAKSVLAEQEGSEDALGVAGASTLAAVSQIVENDELAQGFSDFYGGLRWSTDQSRFTNSLFEGAVELDIEAVASRLKSGSHIRSFSYYLDHDLPYETIKNWQGMSADAVFAKHPEFDPRRLNDDTFRDSEQGAALERACRRYTSQELQARYSSGRFNIDETGKIIETPLLPLAAFPLIEALIADEILAIAPRSKYNFGPSDVSHLVLSSDSVKAQQALVAAVSTRLPVEQREVFDGPDEMELKRSLTSEIMHTFKDEKNRERQAVLKDQVVEILGAFVGNGSMAVSLRDEQAQWNERFEGLCREVWGGKRIVRDILTLGLASGDAPEIFEHFTSSSAEYAGSAQDPLLLTTAELQGIVLDSLRHVDSRTNPDFIGLIAQSNFGPEVAGMIHEVAALRAEASRLSGKPEVLLARRAWSMSSATIGEKEKEDLKAAYMAADAGGQELRDRAHDVLNQLLITEMYLALSHPDISESTKRITSLIDKLYLGDSYRMVELPEVYYQLMDVARDTRSTSEIGAKVLWKFAEHYKYTGETGTKQLNTIVIDGYRLMLGDPSQPLDVPDREAGSGLDAINHIASHNVFKEATEAQLQELSRYRAALLDLVERFTGKQLQVGSLDEVSLMEHHDPDAADRTSYDIQSVVRSFARLEEQYAQFLYIEQVKREPHLYYPWVIQKLAPFWQKMQWEVGPGNRPKADIQKLHDTLQHLIDTKLDTAAELEVGYDVFAQGGLDELLIECFEQMVVPHGIKYNNTVWREGLSFMLNAVLMMPKQVVEQFKEKYGSNHPFVVYLENERKRFNKDEQKQPSALDE